MIWGEAKVTRRWKEEESAYHCSLERLDEIDALSDSGSFYSSSLLLVFAWDAILVVSFVLHQQL